jgi:hypothetical protein
MGIDFPLVPTVFQFAVTTIPILVAPAEGYPVPNPLKTLVVLLQLQTR